MASQVLLSHSWSGRAVGVVFKAETHLQPHGCLLPTISTFLYFPVWIRVIARHWFLMDFPGTLVRPVNQSSAQDECKNRWGGTYSLYIYGWRDSVEKQCVLSNTAQRGFWGKRWPIWFFWEWKKKEWNLDFFTVLLTWLMTAAFKQVVQGARFA